jgi:hypothetical protein
MSNIDAVKLGALLEKAFQDPLFPTLQPFPPRDNDNNELAIIQAAYQQAKDMERLNAKIDALEVKARTVIPSPIIIPAKPAIIWPQREAYEAEELLGWLRELRLLKTDKEYERLLRLAGAEDFNLYRQTPLPPEESAEQRIRRKYGAIF